MILAAHHLLTALLLLLLGWTSMQPETRPVSLPVSLLEYRLAMAFGAVAASGAHLFIGAVAFSAWWMR